MKSLACIYIYIGIVFTSLLMGCTDNSLVDADEFEGMKNLRISLDIHVPVSSLPSASSRGLNPTTTDGDIDKDNFTLLMFSGEGDDATYLRSMSAEEVTLARQEEGVDKWSLNAIVPEFEGKLTIAMVANVNDKIKNLDTGTEEEPETKSVILAQLTYLLSDDLTYMPLYGEIVLDSENIDATGTLYLKRAMAKVVIDAREAFDHFKLQSVEIININSGGYICNGVIEDKTKIETKPISPINSDTFEPVQSAETNFITFYIPEIDTNAGVEGKDAETSIAVIVRAKYKETKDQYYRFDFIRNDNHEYVTKVERNYCYYFSLKYMSTTGYETQEKAKNNKAINKAQEGLGVVVINDENIMNITTDGLYYLGVTTEEIILAGKNEDTYFAMFSVKCNNTEGWYTNADELNEYGITMNMSSFKPTATDEVTVQAVKDVWVYFPLPTTPEGNAEDDTDLVEPGDVVSFYIYSGMLRKEITVQIPDYAKRNIQFSFGGNNVTENLEVTVTGTVFVDKGEYDVMTGWPISIDYDPKTQSQEILTFTYVTEDKITYQTTYTVEEFVALSQQMDVEMNQLNMAKTKNMNIIYYNENNAHNTLAANLTESTSDQTIIVDVKTYDNTNRWPINVVYKEEQLDEKLTFMNEQTGIRYERSMSVREFVEWEESEPLILDRAIKKINFKYGNTTIIEGLNIETSGSFSIDYEYVTDDTNASDSHWEISVEGYTPTSANENIIFSYTDVTTDENGEIISETPYQLTISAKDFLKLSDSIELGKMAASQTKHLKFNYYTTDAETEVTSGLEITTGYDIALKEEPSYTDGYWPITIAVYGEHEDNNITFAYTADNDVVFQKVMTAASFDNLEDNATVTFEQANRNMLFLAGEGGEAILADLKLTIGGTETTISYAGDEDTPGYWNIPISGLDDKGRLDVVMNFTYTDANTSTNYSISMTVGDFLNIAKNGVVELNEIKSTILYLQRHDANGNISHQDQLTVYVDGQEVSYLTYTISNDQFSMEYNSVIKEKVVRFEYTIKSGKDLYVYEIKVEDLFNLPTKSTLLLDEQVTKVFTATWGTDKQSIDKDLIITLGEITIPCAYDSTTGKWQFTTLHNTQKINARDMIFTYSDGTDTYEYKTTGNFIISSTDNINLIKVVTTG